MRKIVLISSLLAVFAIAPFAHASVLVSQPDASVLLTDSTNTGNTNGVIATNTGVPLSLKVWYGDTSGHSSQGFFYAINDQTTGMTCGNTVMVPLVSSALQEYDVDLTQNTPSAGCSSVINAGDNVTIQFYGYDSGSAAHIDSYSSDGTYANLFWEVDDTPPLPSNTSTAYTHVISVSSPTAYATSSSPVNFTFTSVVNTDVGSSTDGYALTVRDETTGLSTVFAFGSLGSYVFGSPFVVSTSTPVATSTALTATIQLVTGYQQYLRTGAYPVFIPASQFTVPFAVGDVYSSRSNPSPTAYAGNTFSSTTCSVNFLGSFDLSGCVGYLVSPSATTMANFADLSQGLQTRAPFVYAYQVGQLRQEMFSASSTGTTTIAVTVPNFGTITFLSEAMIAAVPFSPLIKTVLGYIMWFLLIDLVYLTVIRSHNENTGI